MWYLQRSKQLSYETKLLVSLERKQSTMVHAETRSPRFLEISMSWQNHAMGVTSATKSGVAQILELQFVQATDMPSEENKTELTWQGSSDFEAEHQREANKKK